MTFLVTGAAGFIGNAISLALLEAGHEVVGLDSLTPYYDVNLKEARLRRLAPFAAFTEARFDLADQDKLDRLFEERRPKVVLHLAAQAGVRYSIEAPRSYIHSNLVGLANLLEACRAIQCEHLLFASSSSVYGLNDHIPFSVHDPADHPISLYAATKRSGELMVHSYSHLFRIPATCLRFFTVYGPWGRPDMALYLFTKSILEGTPIKVFNAGNMRRAFTYIDDVVTSVIKLIDKIPAAEPDRAPRSPAVSPAAPFRVLNIGSEQMVELERYIELIEQELGREAIREMLPLQPGDVLSSAPDASDLRALIDWSPQTPIEAGVTEFLHWYRDYHQVA